MSVIRPRRIIAVMRGAVDAATWWTALRDEAPVHGAPNACSACPLRRGGEWEEGARVALRTMKSTQRKALAGGWGCHAGARPCAGMVRLVAEAARFGVLTVGSCFSGIGGLELGFERAALGRVIWQIENDPSAVAVLEKHWPGVDRYGDIQSVVCERLPSVDLLCGGFPCQDLSDASRGRGAGLAGPQSGLWAEMLRLIKGLEPDWVVIENVAGAAANRWVPGVRGDLWIEGYASVPIRMPAFAVGAPFKGDRIFLVAKADGDGESARAVYEEMAGMPPPPRLGRHWRESAPWDLGVADGLPGGMDRLRLAGNAVVPQQAEWLGRAIKQVVDAHG